MASKSQLEIDAILNKLESKEYLKSDNESSENVKEQIIKFFTWFNEVARKSLLCCSNQEKNEYIFLLLELKKQIKRSISELGNSCSNKKQEFHCGLCDEKIIVKPWQDTWDCLQNHSHFDQLCLNFLEGREEENINEQTTNEVIHNLTEKLDHLFKNLDKIVKPLKFDQDCEEPDDQMNCETTRPSTSSENNSRLWYDFSALKITEDPCNSSKAVQNSASVSEKPTPASKTDRNHDEDINNFRFKFQNGYDPIIQQSLYPKFYQKFKHDEYYVIQRAGAHRTVCLTCQCELIMQKSTHNIFNHISGQRHMRRLSNPICVASIRNYHDTFYGLEPNMQAHQVYFLPDDDPMLVKCVLCILYVRRHEVLAHILNEPHKSKVVQLSYDVNVKYSFYLLGYHLDVYGIKEEVNKILEGQQVPSQNNGTVRREVQKGRRRQVIMNGVRNDVDFKAHEIVKSIEDPKDPNIIKTLPRRFNEHKKFLQNKGSSVICSACPKKSMNSAKDLKLHLIQSSHLASTKLSLLEYKYFCEICDQKFHDEMTWHMHFNRNNNKHETMAPSRKELVCEHECLTCKAVIYGDALSLRRHQNSFIRKIEKKKETVLTDDAKKYFGSKSSIIENGQALLDDAHRVRDNKQAMVRVCQDMENALSSHFENCKAYPFGSRKSGLGSSDSDLDVFIDIGGMYTGAQKQDDYNQFEIIKASLDLFRKTREFYKITSRPTARTPIIRLKHRFTELDCDISFRHGLSVENTKFLMFCFDLQPISQQFTLLLKKWSHLCGLNENITTYAFAMMAIFYLQTERYLISVKTLKELNPQEGVAIDGWETISYTRSVEEVRQYVKIYKGNVVELLKGFYKYYAAFKYKTDIICPLLGEIIPKSLFTDDMMQGTKLPKEMSTYVQKIRSDDGAEHFRALSEFCIQDPFDLSHNLTKACNSRIVEKFKKLCSLSYEMLNKFED